MGSRPTVSLVLGSGGARGLAHIGVIRELESRGYDIRAISGSSMGALVGGIHAWRTVFYINTGAAIVLAQG